MHSLLLKVKSYTYVNQNYLVFVLLRKIHARPLTGMKQTSLAMKLDGLKVNSKLLVIHDLVGLRADIPKVQHVPVSTK